MYDMPRVTLMPKSVSIRSATLLQYMIVTYLDIRKGKVFI